MACRLDADLVRRSDQWHRTAFYQRASDAKRNRRNVTLGRKLTNNGATTWTGGTLSMASGTFQNNGPFTADSATNQTITRTSGTNVFNNAGSFIKKNSSTLTFSNVAFNNTGTVEIQGGSIALDKHL